MSKPNKFAALTSLTTSPVAAPEVAQVPEPVAAPEPVDTPAPASIPLGTAPELTRMLAGRVPDSIFDEFQDQKRGVGRAMGVRRSITNEEGLEAFVRMLRQPAMMQAWQMQLAQVRQERRD
ncbi:hypothetical protein [Deinococcus sp. Leaf326]|uniref:hypothetical protein n=1 Tax=Deinococcus sp. Leaf326 TaxID=1736338 RepID=UPI000701022B|nr:hypothetical protein [Deinococcus sp. Leaf326]KQR33146.1 hypothetical protein ASF71_16785 [Deinococcus sp. Leaf326]